LVKFAQPFDDPNARLRELIEGKGGEDDLVAFMQKMIHSAGAPEARMEH
jgi:hypothetical protein